MGLMGPITLDIYHTFKGVLMGPVTSPENRVNDVHRWLAKGRVVLA